MYVSMYGCAKYHYGFSDDELAKCENSKGYGMVAAMYWILFIMLSSLVMLNLVVGVVCSAMAQATEDDKNLKKKLAMMERVARETRIPRAVLDAWESGFQELDDSEGYGSGNIRVRSISRRTTIAALFALAIHCIGLIIIVVSRAARGSEPTAHDSGRSGPLE